jgi:hypothetical protein
VEIISGDLTADRSSEQREGLVDVDLVIDIDKPVLVLQFMVNRAPYPVQDVPVDCELYAPSNAVIGDRTWIAYMVNRCGVRSAPCTSWADVLLIGSRPKASYAIEGVKLIGSTAEADLLGYGFVVPRDSFNRLDAAQATIDERQLQTTPTSRHHISSLLGRGCPPEKAVEIALKANV